MKEKARHIKRHNGKRRESYVIFTSSFSKCVKNFEERNLLFHSKDLEKTPIKHEK